MSDNSTTTTIQLDEERQVLEISDSMVNCTVLFTVQTDGIPFDFAVVDQKSLDDDDFVFNKVENGYVSGTAKNINKPTFMVLKSETPCEANITLQRTGTKSVKRTPIQQNTKKGQSQKSATATDATPKKKFYKNPIFIAGLVLIAVGAFYWMRRKKKPDTTINTKKNITPISSLLSNDPQVSSSSSEGSSQSFGF